MSQVSIIDIEGNHPEIPTQFDANVGFAIPIGNVLEILGDTQAAGTTPVHTVGSGNTITTYVQISQAIGASDATKIGLSNFNSSHFSVDANGFVSLAGGGASIDSIGTQTGTNPIVPNGAGLVTINGAVVAAGTNPIRSDGTGANTMAIEVQISQAIPSTDATKIGLAAFDSAAFAVDANGFVSLSGGGLAIESLHPDSGTDPVVPTGGGLVNIVGSGSTTTVGSLHTLTVQLTGLTNHAVLVGAGTTTITKLAVGTNGQLLIGGTAADPAFATVGTNANMNTVVGANSLTLNPYNCSKWIVDPTANIGTHTTISAAIASAASGDTIFIRPGTYTENLTMKAGVNLCAFTCDGLISVYNATPNVIILGKVTFGYTGTCCVSGVQFKTNGDYCIYFTSANDTRAYISNCNILANNNTAINNDNTGTSSHLNFFYCTGDIATAGIAYFTKTNNSNFRFFSCYFVNSAGSTTPSTVSGAGLYIQASNISNTINCTNTSSTINSSTLQSLSFDGGSPTIDSSFSTGTISLTNAAILTINNSNVSGAITTANTSSLISNSCSFLSLTLSDTSTANLSNCKFLSGSSSSVTSNVGTTATLSNCVISSSNTNTISGAGTVVYSGLSFPSTSSTINTTTQVVKSEGPSRTIGSLNNGGTNTLTVINSSNTASSAANILVSTAGATAADPTTQWSTTATNWTAGCDNSASDTWVLSKGTALGTNDVMQVQTTGEINFPLQSAFLSYLSASVLNVTGDGTTYTILFNSTQFDQNADFNTTTGVFTAPTTGKYQLSFVVSLQQLGVANTDLLIQINTSNLVNIQSLRTNPTATAQATSNNYCGSLLCDMDAADTARIDVTVSGGTKIVDVGGTKSGGSFFSGYQAC